MQYKNATELELRLAEAIDRCERELPASELETTVVVCLSDAANELQRLRTKIGDAYSDLARALDGYPRVGHHSLWARYMWIEQRAPGQIWVRWTGADGIYRWLHPTENRWVEEPEQVGMPLFRNHASAMLAARRSPMPPTWGEVSA